MKASNEIIAKRGRKIKILAVYIGIFQFLLNPVAYASKTVKVGIYNNKPLVCVNDVGRPEGIFVDFLEHVAVTEQWDLTFIFGTWSDCLDRLESGEIDLLPAIAYSKVRAKKFNFTYQTVMNNWGQVFVAKNFKIASVLDLDLKKIAVKMDDIHLQRMRTE